MDPIPKNIFTIDYEDWFTTSHYKSVVNDKNKKYLLEKPTFQILDLLGKNGIKATFFVLGQVAKDCPDLIKTIHSKGHEIANHGFSHTPLKFLSYQTFTHEVRETNKILEDITQGKVRGFRAPFFSINHDTSWALDILKDEKFEYDSSIFPMKTPRYGINHAPSMPYYISSLDLTIPSDQKQLLEVPVSIYRNRWLKVPCSGGIYGRFLPEKLLLFLLNGIQKNGFIHLYVHPWELINKKAQTPYPGFLKNFLSNYNSEQYLFKLEKTIQNFQFTNIKTWIQENYSYL